MMDSSEIFIATRLTKTDYENVTSRENIYSAYIDFCRKKNLNGCSAKHLYRNMRERGILERKSNGIRYFMCVIHKGLKMDEQEAIDIRLKMDEQEAIDILRLMMRLRVPEETKAIGVAIKALEKQIYELPAVNFRTHKYACPTCGSSLNLEIYRDGYGYACINMGRCMKCGQLIDWRKDDGEEK